jgi:hypothetical protein
MSNDRPDLPTFDGRDVREHASAAAEAVRAINHITGWPHGMTYPSDAYSVTSRLASVAAMMPQACRQIDRQLAKWHAAGHIGIDRGQPFAGNPDGAVAVVAEAFDKAAARAEHLCVALDRAVQVLAAAHWTGPDRYVEIVDDREVND